MTPQQKANDIIDRSVMVVCDSWVIPRHERIVLVLGNPANISHGMCPACEATIRKTTWQEEPES